MKKLLKFSAFSKFIITYFCIVLTTICLTLPIYNKTLEISRENIISSDYQIFSSNLHKFEKSLSQFYQVQYVMETNADYQSIKRLKGDVTPLEVYYRLIQAQKVFYKSTYWNDYIDQAYLIFPGNNVVLTKDKIFSNDSTKFSDFIDYSISDSELKEALFNSESRWQFIPACSITIDNIEHPNALTFVCHSADELAHFGGIIADAQLEKLFGISRYGENSFCYIQDIDGNVLYADGYSEKLGINLQSDISNPQLDSIDYTLLRVPMSDLGGSAVIGIPDRYFVDSVSPVRHLVAMLILLVAVVGAVISIVFANFNYRPIHKILHAPYLAGKFPKKQRMDEYDFIGNTLQTFNQENQTLNHELLSMGNHLKANLFLRALRGDLATTEDQTLVLELLPQLSNSFQVALIQLEDSDDPEMTDMSCLLIEATISHIAPEQFVTNRIDKYHQAVLFPAQAFCTENFLAAVENIRSNLRLFYKTDILTGMSECSSGVDSVRAAFEQARYALRDSSLVPMESIKVYQPSGNETAKVFEYSSIQKLYELTLSGEISIIREMLNQTEQKLAGLSSNFQKQLEECVYILRFVCHNIMIDQHLDETVIELPDYKFNADAVVLFTAFGDCFEELCQQIGQKRCSNNQSLKNGIIEYIVANCCLPDLYADTVANKFGISEKHFYRLIREHTGQSFGEYIEQLRMNIALDLIKNTAEPVASVAATCGFNSVNTFYRIFKKHFSISPTTFRKSIN